MDAEALAKILNCSVPDPSYLDLIGRRRLSKKTDMELIAVAKRLADSLTKRIPEWEQMRNAELLDNMDVIFDVVSALENVAIFGIGAPTREFMSSWAAVLDAMPDDGFRRLNALGGKVARLKIAEPFLQAEKAASASAKWSKLEPVKQWLVAERRANPGGHRGAFIGKKLTEIRQRAQQVGCPLTGGDDSVKKTCKGWLKEEGIN